MQSNRRFISSQLCRLSLGWVLFSNAANAQYVNLVPTGNQEVKQPSGTRLKVNALDVEQLSGAVHADPYCAGKAPWSEDCIQEAINKLPSKGGAVYLRAGTWNISNGIVVTKDNVALLGAGAATELWNSGTGAAITTNPGTSSVRSNVTIRDLALTSGPGTGTGIHIQFTNQAHIFNVNIWNFETGIKVSGGSYNNHITQFFMGSVMSGVHIENSNAAGSPSTDLFLTSGQIGVRAGGTGLLWINGDGVNVNNLNILNGAKSVVLAPGVGQQASGGLFSNVHGDSPSQQAWVLYPNGGKVLSIFVTNSSASSAATDPKNPPPPGVSGVGDGVLFSGTAGVIDSFRWVGGRVLNNRSNGVHIAGGSPVKMRNIAIQNAHIHQNSVGGWRAFDGIAVTQPVDGLTITNNTIGVGPCCTTSGGDAQPVNFQRYGLHVSETASGTAFIVMGNDLRYNGLGMRIVSGSGISEPNL